MKEAKYCIMIQEGYVYSESWHPLFVGTKSECDELIAQVREIQKSYIKLCELQKKDGADWDDIEETKEFTLDLIRELCKISETPFDFEFINDENLEQFDFVETMFSIHEVANYDNFKRLREKQNEHTE